MIVGLGSDIVNIKRIENLLQKYGQNLVKKILDADEQAVYARLNDHKKSSYLAKRWAAKEACSKALGTGFQYGITWRQIKIVNLSDGKPEILLFDAAAKQAIVLCEGKAAKIMLSLSDDYPWAQAVVIIESL